MNSKSNWTLLPHTPTDRLVLSMHVHTVQGITRKCSHSIAPGVAKFSNTLDIQVSWFGPWKPAIHKTLVRLLVAENMKGETKPSSEYVHSIRSPINSRLASYLYPRNPEYLCACVHTSIYSPPLMTSSHYRSSLNSVLPPPQNPQQNCL